MSDSKEYRSRKESSSTEDSAKEIIDVETDSTGEGKGELEQRDDTGEVGGLVKQIEGMGLEEGDPKEKQVETVPSTRPEKESKEEPITDVNSMFRQLMASMENNKMSYQENFKKLFDDNKKLSDKLDNNITRLEQQMNGMKKNLVQTKEEVLPIEPAKVQNTMVTGQYGSNITSILRKPEKRNSVVVIEALPLKILCGQPRLSININMNTIFSSSDNLNSILKNLLSNDHRYRKLDLRKNWDIPELTQGMEQYVNTVHYPTMIWSTTSQITCR